MSREYHNEYDPGSLGDDEIARLDRRLYIEFHLMPMEDQLATSGGQIPSDHPRVEELKNLGCEITPHPSEPSLVIVEPVGRPIFKELEFIKIIAPGGKDNINDRPVTQEDKKRFPRQYAAFKAGLSQEAASGTPLKEVSFVDSAQREELAYFNVRTVEQLANISDANLQKFMTGHALRDKAKRYLDGHVNANAAAASAEALHKQEAVNAELRAELAKLRAKLEEQQEKSEAARGN